MSSREERRPCFFGVSSSVTECFQSVTDYLQPVTELGTPKNMAVALPGMTLQPLYIRSYIKNTQQDGANCILVLVTQNNLKFKWPKSILGKKKFNISKNNTTA